MQILPKYRSFAVSSLLYNTMTLLTSGKFFCTVQNFRSQLQLKSSLTFNYKVVLELISRLLA